MLKIALVLAFCFCGRCRCHPDVVGGEMGEFLRSVELIDENLNLKLDTTDDDDDTKLRDILWDSMLEIGGQLSDISSSSSAEGSGTDEETSTTLPTTATTTSCFDSECDVDELSGVPESLSSPESSVVHVTCTTSCGGPSPSLFWFFIGSNDSRPVLKTTSVGDDRQHHHHHQVNLTLSASSVSDSGFYRCVKRDLDRCCYREMELVVYVPTPSGIKDNHVLIVGIVAVLFLVVCLSLVVFRNYKVQRRSKKNRESI